MKVALFSDIHGHLRVLLHCIRCWQLSHGEFLDYALVPGDLGCYPDETRMDSATRRHVERNPEEAGFARYFVEPHESVEEMLAPMPHLNEFSEVRCPVFFVAGNHEDHAFLRTRAAEAPRTATAFPTDCYQQFHCVRDGSVLKLTGRNNEVFRVAGLWGIEVADERKPYAIDIKAATTLATLPVGSVDLLLTHDAPEHVWQHRTGSPTISELINTLRPPLHLFGHVKPNAGQRIFQVPGTNTESWLLENLTFGKSGNDKLEGTMAVLDWKSPADWSITPVEEPWLKAMTGKTWRKVWPAT
jgi:Icc-related predicted phosphoesterase